MNDLISRKALLAEYDRVHIGEPGQARKLIENAPAVDEPHWATEQAYKNGYEQGKKDAEYEIQILKQKRANMFEILDAYERGRANALKWIPVSERLPEEGDSVLALCWHHEAWIPFVCHLSVNFKGRWITNMAGQWMVHVSHWMPLPEPPKGE